jgi:glucoamylase
LDRRRQGWRRRGVFDRQPHLVFDEARNGNVALTGELNLSKTREFTDGLAFGQTLFNAVSRLFQALNLSMIAEFLI